MIDILSIINLYVLPYLAYIILGALIIFGILTSVVAKNKGRNSFGWFLLGLILGPIALAIILIALPIHYYVRSGDDDL